MKKIIAIALALIVALSLTVSLSATALGSKGFIPFKLAGEGSGGSGGSGSGSGSGSGNGGSGENVDQTEATKPDPENTTKAGENENTTKAGENENTTKAGENENTTANSDEEKKNDLLSKLKEWLDKQNLPFGLTSDKIIDVLKKLKLTDLINGIGDGSSFDLSKIISFVTGLIGGSGGSGSGEKTTANNVTPDPVPMRNETCPYVPNVNCGDAE